MAPSWQHWLSPRPAQRTKYVHDASVRDEHGSILFEFPMYKGHRAVRETHDLKEQNVREGRSGPPL